MNAMNATNATNESCSLCDEPRAYGEKLCTYHQGLEDGVALFRSK
jgi:hypothetical protein